MATDATVIATSYAEKEGTAWPHCFLKSNVRLLETQLHPLLSYPSQPVGLGFASAKYGT